MTLIDTAPMIALADKGQRTHQECRAAVAQLAGAPITKRVETVLVQRYGHKELDKRRVMSEILRRFDGWEKVSDLPKGTASKAEKLFQTINNTFGGGASN